MATAEEMVEIMKRGKKPDLVVGRAEPLTGVAPELDIAEIAKMASPVIRPKFSPFETALLEKLDTLHGALLELRRILIGESKE
jgi:hypothetical protein